jgi:hypothetical protein
MLKPLFVAALCLGLAGCAVPAAVSDISDSAVKVRGHWLTKPEDVLATANESCAIYGKTAIPLSSICVGGGCDYKDYLFACKAPAVSQSLAPAATKPATAPNIPPPASTSVSPQVFSSVQAQKACKLKDGRVTAATEDDCKTAGGQPAPF